MELLFCFPVYTNEQKTNKQTNKQASKQTNETNTWTWDWKMVWVDLMAYQTLVGYLVLFFYIYIKYIICKRILEIHKNKWSSSSISNDSIYRKSHS